MRPTCIISFNFKSIKTKDHGTGCNAIEFLIKGPIPSLKKIEKRPGTKPRPITLRINPACETMESYR